MDTELRGLPFTLTVSPLPNPVLATSAERSDIELSHRSSDLSLVNPATAEMSEIELCLRDSVFRLIACSSPIKSLMLDLLAVIWVNAAISDVVMVSPAVLPNAFSITARRLESGSCTTTPATISSNSTVTPLLWRTGMCVSIDTALKGLPFTLTVSPLPNAILAISAERSTIEFLSRTNHVRLVNPINAERSDIELLARYKVLRLVNLINTEMSEMKLDERCNVLRLVNLINTEISEMRLDERYKVLRLVNLINAEMSEIELFPRYSDVRLIACSSPVKSLMLDRLAVSSVNSAISEVVMVSPASLSKAFSITARRFESGSCTTSPATISSNSTVAPLLWRAGICVSMETALRGLPFTSTVSPLPKPALATSAEMSDIEFLSRASHVSFVSSATAEMSEIELSRRLSEYRLVNPVTAEMSEIEFPLRYSALRLVNPATAEMSEIEFQLRVRYARLVNPATAEISEIELA